MESIASYATDIITIGKELVNFMFTTPLGIFITVGIMGSVVMLISQIRHA